MVWTKGRLDGCAYSQTPTFLWHFRLIWSEAYLDHIII